jgi:hypothetical protein
MSATEILSQARELPPEQQREIAETLLNELEQEESPEFIAELERRAEGLRNHPENGIRLERVKAELEDRLKKFRA